MSSLPFPFPLSDEQIRSYRARILITLCANDDGFCQIPVVSVRQATLLKMLTLYDDVFLAGYLAGKLSMLTVTLSSRLTSSAGKFLCTRGAFRRIKTAEIRMSSDYLLRLDQGPFSLNGLTVSTPQEAFLIVFEHELCHALETALWGKTGHSSSFLSLAKGLFGHTATRHSLPTRRQEAAKDGMYVGMRASFSYQGHELSGVVTYIGKTATFMVTDARGEYRDKSGQRYSKYRVALTNIKRIP